MTPRTPPLELLTPRQYRDYWENGYLILRGVLGPDTMGPLSEECRKLLTRQDIFIDIPEAAVRRDQHGNPVRDRLDPVLKYSPLIEGISRDTRITQGVADIFGDGAKLLRDKVIFKPPGVKGYGLHQDYAYWEWIGIPPGDAISVMVAIDRADRDTGPLIVYPGLHHGRLPAPPDDPRDVDPAAVDPATEVWCEAEPGDVVFFHSMTPHRSEPNRTDRFRRVLYLTYNAAKHGDLYDRYQHKRFH